MQMQSWTCREGKDWRKETNGERLNEGKWKSKESDLEIVLDWLNGTVENTQNKNRWQSRKVFSLKFYFSFILYTVKHIFELRRFGFRKVSAFFIRLQHANWNWEYLKPERGNNHPIRKRLEVRCSWIKLWPLVLKQNWGNSGIIKRNIYNVFSICIR